MPAATMTPRIERNSDGVLRVGGTRVTLDTIVNAFQAGATAEEIALRYSSVDLLDVYLTISHYLQNRAEVEEYLRERRHLSAAVRYENEIRCPQEGIRSRLLARRSQQGD